MLDKVKRTLVYHFYTFRGYKDNYAVKIHFKCLERYSKAFDKIIFVIALDEMENNAELINDTKLSVLNILNCNDITIKVVKNTQYREALTFYNEITLNLQNFDGIVFFAHNKGITNYTERNNWDSVNNWLCGMYYLSLEDPCYADESLIGKGRKFYGSYLTKGEISRSKSQWCYSGTFFWLSPKDIYNDYLKADEYLKNGPYNRQYAECFPGNLYDWENAHKLDSLYSLAIIADDKEDVDFYLDSFTPTGQLLFNDDEKINEFIKFRDEIFKEIEEQ